MGSFNGTGTFVRSYDWTTDEANGINIEASRMDTEDDGFATGLSTCITKDGQTTISANIPFNSKKITGLGNGSARTDSIALGQVQDGTYLTLGIAGGSADVYTASPSPAITTYATGSRYIIEIQADNTGASTLNISAVDTKDMKKYDGAGAKVDLEAGDLQQNQYYDIFYDGVDIVVINPGKPHLDGTNFVGIPRIAGESIQVVHIQDGEVATGVTTIPNDDTIPQNTEGDEYITLSVTPTSATNKLRIDVDIQLSNSASTPILIAALFQDTTADALTVGATKAESTLAPKSIAFSHYMTSGTISSTTFKVRCGANAAGTTTFNGQSGSRRFGGVFSSSITITEIAV